MNVLNMGKFSDFKILLKTMPEGEHHFDFHLDKQFFKNMENPDIRDANVNVDLCVKHRGDIYEMHMHLVGVLVLLCDRCLDELPIDIDTCYDINIEYGDDYNDDSDTLLIIPESDNYLNVAYMIYDTAALAIPPRHVHPMGKCNRAMSALLKKHNARHDEDADLEDQLIDEMVDMDTAPDGGDTD